MNAEACSHALVCEAIRCALKFHKILLRSSDYSQIIVILRWIPMKRNVIGWLRWVLFSGVNSTAICSAALCFIACFSHFIWLFSLLLIFLTRMSNKFPHSLPFISFTIIRILLQRHSNAMKCGKQQWADKNQNNISKIMNEIVAMGCDVAIHLNVCDQIWCFVSPPAKEHSCSSLAALALAVSLLSLFIFCEMKITFIASNHADKSTYWNSCVVERGRTEINRMLRYQKWFFTYTTKSTDININKPHWIGIY